MSDDEDDRPRRKRSARKKRRGGEDDSPDLEKGRKTTDDDGETGGRRKKGKEEKFDFEVNVDDMAKAFEPVNAAIQTIRDNTGKLRKIDPKQPDEKSRARVNKQIDTLIDDTNKVAMRVKQMLTKIKSANAEADKAKKAGKEVRENLFKKAGTDYAQALTEWKDLTENLKKSMVDDKKRQLKNVSESIGQSLPDDKIDLIVNHGQADAVIQQVMMEDNARLEDVVADIEERHTEILHLERQLLEVFELFKDLANLVDIQGEQLDTIEGNISKAQMHVTTAEKDLTEAERLQRKARKKQCMILGCCIAILIVIIAPTLASVLKNG